MVYLVGKLGPLSNFQNSNFNPGDNAMTGRKGCAAANFEGCENFVGSLVKLYQQKVTPALNGKYQNNILVLSFKRSIF